MIGKSLCLTTFILLLFASALNAQDCTPPKIIANANSSNLFNAEQEMIFGELVLSNMSGEIRIVRNDELLAYVNSIGERLIKHLPTSGLRFTFHIIDIPEANAFNTPGGHVFLSRKLIAFTANEDELAGVIAHELGHAVVHHGAVDISEDFRRILKITSLGDRKDIAEKYNLLIENYRTKNISRRNSHENEQQLEADRIGLFAMTMAGYTPSAFTSFFDRLAETEGKTGSWFSNIFGTTRPEQKRLREMIKATEQLPRTCRENRTARPDEIFLKWQADVVSFRDRGRSENLPGLLWKKELAPKMRSDVTHLTFSFDGKYLLAQDDFAISIIQREPLQMLFQIPAEQAREAEFTGDGKQIVFTTEDLRFERWDIAEQKPLEIREIVLRGDCYEHELSPNGNFLACVDTRLNVRVLETKTGKKLWEKKDFYPLSGLEYYFWLYSDSRRRDQLDRTNFFRIEFSPDSRIVMFSRSDRFRFRINIDFEIMDGSENTALALDLTTLKPIDLGGDIKKIVSRPYVFLDSGRILGIPSMKPEENGIISFPGGKRLQKFPFAARVIKRTANSNYVIIKPLTESRTGVFDVAKGVVVGARNKADATIWNDLVAFESAAGKIVIQKFKYNESEKKFDVTDIAAVDIPVGAMNDLETAGISNNFSWLFLSSKTRGGLWDLTTGERKVFVRGFRGGLITEKGESISEFAKLDDVPHSLVYINPLNNQITPFRELPPRGAKQYGRFVLTRTSLKESEKKTEKPKPTLPTQNEDEEFPLDLREAVRFELKDFLQDKVVWTRDFPKTAPMYSVDEYSGRLILYWQLGSEVGKAKLKEKPELQAKADALGQKADDYLIEIIDAFAQKDIGVLLVETGKGSFDVGAGLSEGDWLLLYDSEGRILIYSIKTGELRHRFFGNNAAMNPRRNQVAVENFPGEINIYNLATGDAQTSFTINGTAVFTRFNLEGDKMFVLSDSQNAYVFDLNKAAVEKK